MNRTDRLYAIVEQLRARAPATMTARELAERFEVSRRTIERDVAALQQAGVPIWSDVGRRGGLGIDPGHTLPPINLTVEEALAVAVALSREVASPFATAGRGAMLKLGAVLAPQVSAGALRVSERIRFLDADSPGPSSRKPADPVVLEAVRRALVEQRVLVLEYCDAAGQATQRTVEPVGVVANTHHWYLVGWCRTREAGRSFRLDRVRAVAVTDERAAARPFELVEDLEAIARQPRWT